MAGMGKLFISHSSQDDDFVRELQQALGDFSQDAWIDSRELRGGDLLWLEVKKAIDEASAYAILVSPDALQSKWVGKELRHALLVQEQRGKDQYPVIPLSLDNTQLGVLEEFFGEAPAYIPVSGEVGGVEAALDAILVALGIRLPADRPASAQPKAEPLEELVLELTDLKIYEQDGIRRAQAKARLVYEPANPSQREVASEKSWRFIAPIGPIEAEELSWYLEKYAIWPSRHFDERAAKVKQSLIEWGRLLYEKALPKEHTANALQAWAKIDRHAGRRFSVYVDKTLVADAPQAEEEAAREAATLLLGLPWELLHNGNGFLFQGAKPTRVRRRLPNTLALDIAPVATPIRILLVTARPEDESCGYIDHRASALPLVDAMEALGGLVQIQLLDPPTLPALSQELARAREQRQPYHVVHFDGHGVYDRRVGLGGLCFEDPQDSAKLENRRHQTIYTDELGPLLSEHRIPLVFLEACQTAQAGQASESVASELLKVGVASVVAMSHSVLVETARRFVEAFYQALASGKRVGDAMLAGQCVLKDDTFRGRVFGIGDFRLEDWFVPVLFQEKDDPQLFRATPARQTRQDSQAALQARLGDTPPPPETGFIGRSRELLALQRLLRQEAYAVVCGQGGEGKTALAAEFARWMVRSQQCRRVAFVSVEMHSTAAAVLDALGRQLLPDYSVATFDDWDKAVQPVERALKEQATLLVLDNMESILLPPFLAEATSALLTEDARRELDEILKLCERLMGGRAAFAPLSPEGRGAGGEGFGSTRLVFTSRENLPAPFDGLRHRRELRQLAKEDAVKLVERALNAQNPLPLGEGRVRELDARTEAIEQLVDAVQGHARSLALLAPSLRKHGVEQTRASLVELMAEMERRHPGNREQSVYASVALSLRRLSPASRERARVLGVFQGGIQLGVLRHMMQWEDAEVAALAKEWVETGLATPNPHNHLSLNPALCPYLLGTLDAEERQALAERWGGAMRVYVDFLVQEDNQNAELAATLTLLELSNLFALLEQVRQTDQAEAVITLAVALYQLLQTFGRPRLLERLSRVCEAAESKLGDAWSHARFEAQRIHIEQQLAGGRLREALDGAQALLRQALAAGETAYPGADYDLALAGILLARMLKNARKPEHALPLLDDACLRFEAIAKEQPNQVATGMDSVCLGERGGVLLDLGWLDEAAAAYEEAIRRAEKLGAERDVAVGKGQLGTVRYLQHRYPEALVACTEARASFERLGGELGSIATAWHQTGMAYQAMGRPDLAEDAYLQALKRWVRLGDAAGQANTLLQLGNLYDDELGRAEDAAAFYRQAADRYVEIGDQAGEGKARNNLSIVLRKLRRLAEARQEIRLAIACFAPFGHASEPWTAWNILAAIESDDGQPAAAAEARAQALRCYLAYRRCGGENHDGPGRLALDVAQALKAGEAARAASLLRQLAANPDADWLRPFIAALQAIVAGSRDPGLADSADLHYTMVVEIRLLLETLAQPG